MATTAEWTGGTAQASFDPTKMQAFMGRLMSDMSGALVGFMCCLADRLGLFKDLAVNGPATSAELSARLGVDERYARELLRGLASAAYLEYAPSTGRFAVPPEHLPALAQEDGPLFMGGGFQLLSGLLGPLDRIEQAFRDGEGVPQDTYGEDLRRGMERMSAGWFENLLVQQWVPSMPTVHARLLAGADVADIGCGSGRALIKLAEAFPASRYVGFDQFGPAIARATANADHAGVADRVRFEQRDVGDGLPGQYDVVTTFHVLHDVHEPLAALRAIRRALRPNGAYMLTENQCSSRVEENAGPAATILYGTSVFYCTPLARAGGADALGGMGLTEPVLRELCAEAGFKSVRRLPLENPFSALYEVLP